MKKLLLIMAIAAGMLQVVGCSYLQSSPTVDRFATYVNVYCAGVSYEVRQVNRAELSSLLTEGTTIAITCPGDPE